MHDIVCAKKQFTKVSKCVSLIRLADKNAVERVRKGADALHYWPLPEPVYEIGTMLVDRDGVFFKKKQRVCRLQKVRFDAMYHAQGIKCHVLLTRRTHACNVLVVLHSSDGSFNAANRVPDSRFVVYNAMTNLPCQFFNAEAEPVAGLVFSRHNPGTMILECPPFKTATYDKSIFAFVDNQGQVVCSVGGRRYHIGDQRVYYLTTSNQILCPVFTFT